MANSGASFRLSADTNAYEEAMARMVTATSETVASVKEHFEGINSTFESMKGIFESAILVLAGGEIASKLNEIAERAAGMREGAEIFNLSTTALQGLQVVAASTGVSSEQLQRTMATLEQKMRAAGEEGGKAAEKFNHLGITTEQLRDPTFTVQDAMEKLGASTNSNAELLSVLGARGAAVIPMMRELADNHDAVSEAAARVGALTTEETGAMAAYRGQVEITSAAWANFSTRIAIGVVPAMEQVMGSMVRFAASAENADIAVNVLRAALDAIGTLLIRDLQIIEDVVAAFEGFGNICVDVFNRVMESVDDLTTGSMVGLAEAIEDIRSGHIDRALTDLTSGIRSAASNLAGTVTDVEGDWGAMTAAISDNAAKATARIQAMQDALAAPPAQAAATPAASTALLPDMSKQAETIEQQLDKVFDKISQEAQGKMQKAFGAITESAAQSVKAQEDVQVGGIDRQIAAVQELGRTHQISNSQELAQETSLINQKWAAEQTYFDRLKALYANNTEKLAQINTQEEAGYQKHLNELQKANEQAATATQKAWQKAGDQISSAFSSAISGMLTKNRTFTQTVMQLGESLVTGLINNFVKMGVAWAEQELEKLIVSKFTASGVIKASAGAAGAAGTASFAAAPWPVDLGAPAFGLAMDGAASSFTVAEHGYNIPAGVNPMVQAHAKEMILPPDLSEGVRDMVSGGGGGREPMHLHIHATDAQSVERLANNHSSVFHRALKKYYGRGGR